MSIGSTVLKEEKEADKEGKVTGARPGLWWAKVSREKGMGIQQWWNQELLKNNYMRKGRKERVKDGPEMG